MRRLSKKDKARVIIINKKHFLRRLASSLLKKYGSRIKNKRKAKDDHKTRDLVIFAPAIIDLYKPINHRLFVEFKNEIEHASYASYTSKRPMRLCFRNTRAITAAACLLLIATVDHIKHKFPSLHIKATRPHRNPVKGVKAPINLVDAVLCQIGFYELIGMDVSASDLNNPCVKCWKFASSTESDGEIAGEILKNIVNHNISKSVIYRSCIEAISNAAEHAYSNEVTTTRKFPIKKWWIFVGNFNSSQVVMICDLGHGIPNTLEITQEEGFLNTLWGKLGLAEKKKHEDWEYIKASTIVKETRTGKPHRGKGTKDLRTFADKTDHSQMVLLSNKGIYRYYSEKSPRRSSAYDNALSIGGTIVEWSVQAMGS